MNKTIIVLLLLSLTLTAQSYYLDRNKDAFSFGGNYSYNSDLHNLGLDFTYSYKASVDVTMRYSGDVPNKEDVKGNYLIPGVKYFPLRQIDKIPVSLSLIGSYLFENYTFADENGRKVNVRSDGLILGGGLYRSINLVQPMRFILFVEYFHPNITVRHNSCQEELDYNRYHDDIIKFGLDVGFPYRNRRLITGGINISRFGDTTYYSLKAGLLFGSFL